MAGQGLNPQGIGKNENFGTTDQEKLSFADSATDPSSNGEVRNNGGTIKAQSNGTVDDILSGGNSHWDDGDLTVVDSASDIQTEIDNLDGTVSGQNGGIVMLKSKTYSPSSTITLKTGVHIVGQQREKREGQNNGNWEFSVIDATNLSAPDTLIETLGKDGSGNVQSRHCGLHNLHINGDSKNIDGVFVDNSPNFWMNQCGVVECRGNAVQFRGAQDCYMGPCVIEGGLVGNSSHALLVTSENDNVGSGSRDTQLKLYGRGRIKSGSQSRAGNTAVKMESSQLNINNYRISMLNPNNPDLAVVNNNSDGTPLVMRDCRITGQSQDGVHGVRNTGNVVMENCWIEKEDIGFIQDGKADTRLDGVRIQQNESHGLKVTGSMGMMDTVYLRSNGESGSGSGLYASGAQFFDPLEGVYFDGNASHAIEIDSIGGGAPGDVPVIKSSNIGAADVDSPTLVVADNRWLEPYTYSLGGTDGTISAADVPVQPYHLRIDAGGSVSALQGIDNIAADGQEVIIEHAGGENVTLSHNASVTNPLLNTSVADETLDANGELVKYVYEAGTGVWRQAWSNIA